MIGIVILSILLACGTLSAQLSGGASTTGAVTISPGPSAVPALPVTSLVAWWEFINSAGGTGASGSTVADLSGNGNTLTFAGAANPVNPVPTSTGLNFPQRIFAPTVSAVLSIAAGTAKTVVVIFNHQLDPTITGGGQGYMVATNTAVNNAIGVFIELIHVNPTAGGYGEFSLVPNSISAISPRGPQVPPNVWTFGAMRNPGTTAFTQNVNVYPNVAGTGPSTMTIGTVQIGNGNNPFIGTIAEVLIWSQSLSDDDLARTFAYLKDRVSPYFVCCG